MAAVEEAVTSEQSAGRSIRDELLAAQEEVNARYEKETDETPAPKEKEASDDRPRDESGRFLPQAEKDAEPASVAAPATEPERAAPVAESHGTEKPDDFVPAPQSWSNAEKALWAAISPEAQKAILRRENDVHRAISAQDEDRNLGREFKRMAQPYEAMFNALGANPVQGFNDYLRVAYVLNTGDPNTKLSALQQIAARHGIQLGGEQQQDNGEGIPPQVAQRIAQLEAQLNQTQTITRQQMEQQQQAEMARTMSEIEVFKSDPANRYFDAVRDHMASLITAGTAQTLKDAYDQAVWARPDIRARLIAEQTAPQRTAEQSRAKAERARSKAVSVRGGTGGMPEVPNQNRSVREELAAAFEEARGRI